MAATTFEQLPEGEAFEFFSRRFDQKAERGPWVKLGERNYRKAADPEDVREIGTLSARVDPVSLDTPAATESVCDRSLPVSPVPPARPTGRK
jgi:hypothetical protein